MRAEHGPYIPSSLTHTYVESPALFHAHPYSNACPHQCRLKGVDERVWGAFVVKKLYYYERRQIQSSWFISGTFKKEAEIKSFKFWTLFISVSGIWSGAATFHFIFINNFNEFGGSYRLISYTRILACNWLGLIIFSAKCSLTTRRYFTSVVWLKLSKELPAILNQSEFICSCLADIQASYSCTTF